MDCESESIEDIEKAGQPQSKSSGMSCDNDSDSSDADSIEMTNADFQSALEDLRECQYSYDKYLRLCELAHETTELDNIRIAYQMFSKVYPLSSELWLKYLRVESTVAQSETEINSVEQLFRKALLDYYAVDIGMEFIKFGERTSDPERIYREMIGVYGINCCNGSKFFEQYRRYIQTSRNLSSSQKLTSYVQSYLNELKYPLEGMEETYIAFKVYCEKNKSELNQAEINIDWDAMDDAYFKAKKQLEKILVFEKGIAPSALDLKWYIKYIKSVESFLNGEIVQTIYERMVSECCLQVECWLLYIAYVQTRSKNSVDEHLKQFALFKQNEIDINSRALRNCPWSHELYINRLHLMEQQGQTHEMIQQALESSLSVGFETAEPSVAIWLEYLTYLRRNTDWNSEESCSVLRKNFDFAWKTLGQQWGVLADTNCEILQFWGRLEYGPLGDAHSGKDLWTTVMNSSNNETKSALWIEFVHLEMKHNLASARDIFSKALNAKELDNPYAIISAWERFERCNGTIKSMKSCQTSCREMLAKLNYTSEARSDSNGTKQRNKISKKSDLAHPAQKPNKRVDALPLKEDTSVPSKSLDINPEKDKVTVFISNLDYNVEEKEILDTLSEISVVSVNIIRSANGRSRGFGYLEVKNEEDVLKALQMDGQQRINGRPMYISKVVRDKEKRVAFKFSDRREENKLFVKNLPPDTTEDDLQKLFNKIEKLKEVRIVYHKSGRSKNIAYIEYEDDIAANNAVKELNEYELKGQKISVQLSEPQPKRNIYLETKQHQTKNKLKIPTRKQPRLSFVPYAVQKKIATEQTNSK